ncbi:MAG: LamG-like jellyroll fold domain-containing protein, partial [bacterium]
MSIRYDNTGNANKIFIYLAGASPSDPAVTSSAYAFGQWIHVAVIRDSSTALKIYVNGVLDGTATISAGQNVDFSGANSFYIGRGFDLDVGAAYYAGYITNVRLVKGQALASGNFTPPTAPV